MMQATIQTQRQAVKELLIDYRSILVERMMTKAHSRELQRQYDLVTEVLLGYGVEELS